MEDEEYIKYLEKKNNMLLWIMMFLVFIMIFAVIFMYKANEAQNFNCNAYWQNHIYENYKADVKKQAYTPLPINFYSNFSTITIEEFKKDGT